jgi:hypothetical protein
MPRLVILNGACKGQELDLQRGTSLLGRAEGVDFAFDDGTVSGRHCELAVTDFGARVRDCGSTNGTFVDNQRVQEAQIKDGQVLRLGEVQMRLMLEPVHIAIPELPPPETLPPATLPDGQPACYNHSDVVATLKCAQCARTFCEPCVRVLRLVGGRSRCFCPVCSGACQPMGPIVGRKPKSFAARLLETIRIHLTRGGSKR